MKLTKIKWEGKITAAVYEEDAIRPIPNYTLMSLIRRSEIENTPLAELAARLASAHPMDLPPIMPLQPVEVWGCDQTYSDASGSGDGESGTRENSAVTVPREARPVIFFKGTSRVCVGPDQPIGIRSDSNFTVPRAELAVVLGSRGSIVGYTLGNDVSASDIERENALYLSQSKMYNACCALGPVIITADELADPRNLEISCTITRQGRTIFSDSFSTSGLNREIETLVEYLLRSNSVPRGSVLLTGTGAIVPREAALQPGDICAVSAPEIGVLSNPVVIVE